MDIKGIMQEYRYKTELHAHTSPVSRCADFSPEDTVRMYKEIGCDSLVITNHMSPYLLEDATDAAQYYLSDYYRAVEAGEKLGVNVILGFEIRFTENFNDYLVYGVSPEDTETAIEYIPAGLETFYREFKNENNIILQAHPFRKKMERAPIELLDGIESFNMHPGHNSVVAVAAQYAKKHDLIVSGGSDFHHADHQGMCFTRSKEIIRDSYDVARLLKSKDYMFDLSGSIVFPYGDRD